MEQTVGHGYEVGSPLGASTGSNVLECFTGRGECVETTRLLHCNSINDAPSDVLGACPRLVSGLTKTATRAVE
jgi:hypothetical protein